MPGRAFAKNALGLLFISIVISPNVARGAASSETQSKAKQEAESSGYIFPASRDEILAKARKEGRLRVLSGLSTPAIKPMIAAFKKRYPFIDTYVEEIEGTDAYQRFLLELKAGMAKWDSNYIPYDNYKAFLPYQMKFDILGMASAGTLTIPARMIDPVNRNTISANTIANVAVYNRKMIAEEKVPSRWEDFLRPEFKGRKFMAEIRPSSVAALVPTWGLEATLDYARKLAVQEPAWVRGGTRAITALQAGEFALGLAVQASSIKRLQAKDPAYVVGYKVVEPVPLRAISRIDGVLRSAASPYAALLWVEFQAGPEGQKILEEQGPFQASIFTPGSAVEKETRGKKLSEVDWQHIARLDEYEAKIVEAYGFPTAK
jgi:iron(III) transport system substrate-binding protein